MESVNHARERSDTLSKKEMSAPPIDLIELDNQDLNWTHLRTALIASIGFFTDAYDLFVVNMCVPMIRFVYFDNKTLPLDEGFMKGTAVFGTLIGQLLFGILADKKGRQKVYGFELMLIIVGTIAATMSASPVRGMNIAAMISIWRLVVGVGIGGDYPLSATITSEFATKGRRGMLMAAVFSMQGIGYLMAGIVSLIFLAIFKHKIMEDPLNIDYVWRFIMGVGVIPALATLYFRLTMPESPRYVQTQEKEIPPASLREFVAHFKQWKHGKVLLGTSLSWFFLDIAYYGITLNQSTIISAIGFAPKYSGNAYDYFYDLAKGNTIVTCMGLLPGYWFSIAFIDKWGRKPIQIMGFVALTVLMGVIAIFYTQLKTVLPLFVAIYSIALFFFNFGPNVTTFVVPGEAFPTRFRSSAHGISAASGKAGAILAAYSFTSAAASEAGLRIIIGAFSFIMILGLASTFLIPETKGRSLEEISSENGSSISESSSEDLRELKDVANEV